MTITRKQLENGRYQGYRTYGYFKSFCDLNDSCEYCDKWIAFLCKVKCVIEKIQTRRILRMCK
jgi:hypothetical protein